MPSSTAGTPNPASPVAPGRRPYDPSVRPHAARRASLATAAAPNVNASPAAASAPTSEGPSILRSSRTVATSTTESASAFATRQRALDAERSRRSTRAAASLGERTPNARTGPNPRARPNGASTAAPSSGRPLANAATDTTTNVPWPR